MVLPRGPSGTGISSLDFAPVMHSHTLPFSRFNIPLDTHYHRHYSSAAQTFLWAPSCYVFGTRRLSRSRDPEFPLRGHWLPLSVVPRCVECYFSHWFFLSSYLRFLALLQPSFRPVYPHHARAYGLCHITSFRSTRVQQQRLVFSCFFSGIVSRYSPGCGSAGRSKRTTKNRLSGTTETHRKDLDASPRGAGAGRHGMQAAGRRIKRKPETGAPRGGYEEACYGLSRSLSLPELSTRRKEAARDNKALFLRGGRHLGTGQGKGRRGELLANTRIPGWKGAQALQCEGS